LKQFTQTTLAPLVRLNQDFVLEAITRLKLPRASRSMWMVLWSAAGRPSPGRFGDSIAIIVKNPSYYPLLAHLAQTGNILRLKNRPGNVHDSKQAVAFRRELIDDLRA
jgi:hypothetical protein